MNTSLPFLRATMCGTTAFAVRNAPRRLMSSVLSQVATSRSDERYGSGDSGNVHQYVDAAMPVQSLFDGSVHLGFFADVAGHTFAPLPSLRISERWFPGLRIHVGR